MPLRFEYTSSTCLPSCQPKEHELQVGEEVLLPLKPKNPLWPEYVKGFLSLPATSSSHGRVYTFDFEESELNGGPTPDPCDFEEPRCFSCCDANLERLNALIASLPVTENDDGTFTFNG